jgi:hypothetical protein
MQFLHARAGGGYHVRQSNRLSSRPERGSAQS